MIPVRWRRAHLPREVRDVIAPVAELDERDGPVLVLVEVLDESRHLGVRHVEEPAAELLQRRAKVLGRELDLECVLGELGLVFAILGARCAQEELEDLRHRHAALLRVDHDRLHLLLGRRVFGDAVHELVRHLAEHVAHAAAHCHILHRHRTALAARGLGRLLPFGLFGRGLLTFGFEHLRIRCLVERARASPEARPSSVAAPAVFAATSGCAHCAADSKILERTGRTDSRTFVAAKATGAWAMRSHGPQLSRWVWSNRS